MRAECYEAHRFLSPVAPQNLAYCAFQIVVPQHPEYAAKILKRQLVRLQKRLLSGVQIGPMKCRAAGHRAHCEHLHFGAFASKIGLGLIPIDLSLLAPAVALRHKRLPRDQAQLKFSVSDVIAHGGLCDRRFREFIQNPPKCAVPCAAACAVPADPPPESRQ